MKIEQNTTSWSNTFLRRMTSWICKELMETPTIVGSSRFTNCSRAFKGMAIGYRGAKSGHILVRIGQTKHFPMTRPYPNRVNTPLVHFEDMIEALVGVAAHEVNHLVQMKNRQAMVERGCEYACNQVLDAFRKDKEGLLARWSNHAEPRDKAPVIEVKCLDAEKRLREWKRKLSLARTKVQIWQKKVDRYQKKAAKSA